MANFNRFNGEKTTGIKLLSLTAVRQDPGKLITHMRALKNQLSYVFGEYGDEVVLHGRSLQPTRPQRPNFDTMALRSTTAATPEGAETPATPSVMTPHEGPPNPLKRKKWRATWEFFCKNMGIVIFFF